MGVRSWDLFCRVVDNFGDIGFCWRLAADLAARGERVRLRVDDRSALAWLAPGGAAGVSVLDWDAAGPEPGDVVVEAFGCDPPAAFVRRMASLSPPPCWINLEHLSAESWVERSHRLASPQFHGPGAGLTKRFFYPGFSARTGGLIREADLARRREGFDAAAWLGSLGIERRSSDERIVSLFCYEQQPALPALLAELSTRPSLLLATAGPAAAQVDRLLGPGLSLGRLRAVRLPRLSQRDYDHLLWASDLNFVRGEDSFVRAQWAAAPFVWQIYPQQDGAHVAKLQAFLGHFLDGVDRQLADDVRAAWAAWNGLAAGADRMPLPSHAGAWRGGCEAWRDTLCSEDDLSTQLLRLVDAAGRAAG